MSSLISLSTDLRTAKAAMGLGDVELARKCGVTRHSIRRVLSGDENFTATTLLSMADALGLAVMLVPKDAAAALRYNQAAVPVRSAVHGLKDL